MTGYQKLKIENKILWKKIHEYLKIIDREGTTNLEIEIIKKEIWWKTHEKKD